MEAMAQQPIEISKAWNTHIYKGMRECFTTHQIYTKIYLTICDPSFYRSTLVLPEWYTGAVYFSNGEHVSDIGSKLTVAIDTRKMKYCL